MLSGGGFLEAYPSNTTEVFIELHAHLNVNFDITTWTQLTSVSEVRGAQANRKPCKAFHSVGSPVKSIHVDLADPSPLPELHLSNHWSGWFQQMARGGAVNNTS